MNVSDWNKIRWKRQKSLKLYTLLLSACWVMFAQGCVEGELTVQYDTAQTNHHTPTPDPGTNNQNGWTDPNNHSPIPTNNNNDPVDPGNNNNNDPVDPGNNNNNDPVDPGNNNSDPEDPDEPDIPTGPQPNDGWIGGSCGSTFDCEYDDAICLTSGHPAGQCSLPCDRTCPDDLNGSNSMTFCITKNGEGRCVSRCDYDLFPDTGCRQGYACRIKERNNQPGVQQAACVPEDETNPNATSPCLRALDDLGIVWSPWNYNTEYDGGLACTVNDPVVVASPINGVEYRYYNQQTPGTMRMSCDLALQLHQLSDILKIYNMTSVLHIGTFNCRRIAGTSSLSQHSYGLAFDIWGLEDQFGADYQLERDWIVDAHPPAAGTKARVLYDIAYHMHDEEVFNIILTPNFNAAHANHFHVDLTSGASMISYTTPLEYWIGNDRNLCPGWD